jgi:Alcohol dehydrogenase transcription factor Myb/SANT-like
VTQCQTRLKQLRDRFNREKKKESEVSKSGAGASQGSSWPLMKLCSFWSDHVKPRNTVSSMAMKPGPSQAQAGTEEAVDQDESLDTPDDW